MKHLALIAALLLAACQPPSQNRYSEMDVGRNAVIEYGRITSMRPVEITGTNSGAGATAGGVAGLYAGSYVGSGSGSIGGALAGAILGAVIGSVAEQAARDRGGMEYIIDMEAGGTQSIVQNVAADDVPLAVGQRVMVQVQGNYRRVLPVAGLAD